MNSTRGGSIAQPSQAIQSGEEKYMNLMNFES